MKTILVILTTILLTGCVGITGHFVYQPEVIDSCNDAVDNDNDGYVDLADKDCESGSEANYQPYEPCIDHDGNNIFVKGYVQTERIHTDTCDDNFVVEYICRDGNAHEIKVECAKCANAVCIN